MIRFQLPFYLLSLEQVPSDLIRSGIGLEGDIFDADDLKNPLAFAVIETNLNTITKLYGPVIRSLHFPMNNANYLSDLRVRDYLFRFVDLANKFGIATIVVHTNCFQTITEFDIRKLPEIRANYLGFFDQLDRELTNTNVKIGVENMPIIGDRGVDFDSVFVLPSDFADFSFKRIGITWDLGHWAYTYFVLQSLSNFSPAITTTSLDFLDFVRLREKITHFHFSSFSGLAYPFLQNVCEEGIVPDQGTIDPAHLSRALATINSWNSPIFMTLEIREVDYTNRFNARATLSWINSHM